MHCDCTENMVCQPCAKSYKNLVWMIRGVAEIHLREQIAQEIEGEGPWCDNPYHRTDDWRSVNGCPCYKFAAAIARGKKNDPR